MNKLQVLSFIFVPNFRRRPLPLKLMVFVLNVSKCYTICPLAPTQLDFSVNPSTFPSFYIHPNPRSPTTFCNHLTSTTITTGLPFHHITHNQHCTTAAIHHRNRTLTPPLNHNMTLDISTG
ncbi:hypothetical protein Hanom_Chr05g00408081 [Helianthus anomalus]